MKINQTNQDNYEGREFKQVYINLTSARCCLKGLSVSQLNPKIA